MRGLGGSNGRSRVLQVAPPSGGAPLAVAVKRNPRARRLVLSVDPADAAPSLVIPPFVSLGEAQAFLDSRRHWLFRRLAAVPARIPFRDGAVVPFLGRTLVLRHVAGSRMAATLEGDALLIGGEAAHLPRRAADWFKAQAKRCFAAAAAAKALALGRPAPRIVVRDPRRQWGSCSADGTLRLSWRLVLAPPAVLDYVVAHEVAHLAEMNHGRAFWTIVARLTPHMATARIWLRRHGHGLLRYG